MPSKNTSDFQLFMAVTQELSKQCVTLSKHQLEMSKNLNLLQTEINEMQAQISFLAENHAHILQHLDCQSGPIPKNMVN